MVDLPLIVDHKKRNLDIYIKLGYKSSINHDLSFIFKNAPHLNSLFNLKSLGPHLSKLRFVDRDQDRLITVTAILFKILIDSPYYEIELS